MCCLGYRVTTDDFYWCFYKDYIAKNYPMRQPDTNKKSVIQFDNSGNIIKIWTSITEASENLHISISDISRVCRTHKLAGGYLWRLYDDYKGEDVSYIDKNKTRVEKLDNDKKVICMYESIG